MACWIDFDRLFDSSCFGSSAAHPCSLKRDSSFASPSVLECPGVHWKRDLSHDSVTVPEIVASRTLDSDLVPF